MTTFSKALRKARPLIESGEERYLCFAIFRALGRWKYESRISRLLDGMCTYEGWVCDNHRATYMKMKSEDFRVGRLQWIDNMIRLEETS